MSKVRFRSALAILALCFLPLAGCAANTPRYAAIEGKTRYGYKDSPNGDGGFTVLAFVPAVWGPKVAREFWDRRAADLCPGGVLRTNIFRAERPTVRYDYNGARPGDYHLEGYLYCKPTEGGGKAG